MSQALTIAGRIVGRVGYGTMQLSGPNAMGPPAEPERAKRALRAAVDAGVRLIDTSAYYGPEVSNRLLVQALHPYPEGLLIATKVGARRTAQGRFSADATPQAVRAAVHDNLRQLRMEVLPLVHARFMPDSKVPFEETVGALAELRGQGLIEHVGVSNVTLELLDRARDVTTIASIENELRFGHTTGLEVLARSVEIQVPYLAFRPLNNGALVGSGSRLADLAQQHRISPATLALAWVLDQADNVAVIPGTQDPAHVDDLIAAESFELSRDLRAALDHIGGGA